MYSYLSLLRLVRYLKSIQGHCFLVMSLLLNMANLQAAYTAEELELPFKQGESLTYHVRYLGIQAGIAIMEVDEQLHELNGHTCYKIQVTGTSSKGLGMLGFKIANKWETYLDIKELRPYKFLAHIQENTYSRKEKIDFDYQNHKARVEVAESTNNMTPEVTYFSFPEDNPTKDIISVYYALRSMDTSKLKTGDHLPLNFLLNDQVRLYANKGTVFLGKKTITTKLGKIQTVVFAPMIPTEHTIFSGKRPVEIFISDDVHKIPIKININLVVGAVEMELTDYKGLKEKLAFQNP